MGNPVESFCVGNLYSSADIQQALCVGNAGGVRVSLSSDGTPRRMVIMTADPSARQARENPYHDRIEGATLVYTGAGREGDQTLGGINQRIPQQYTGLFPIYCFVLIGSRRDQKIGPKRWRFVGLLQYLRHYPETQVDVRLQVRRVWVFELRIHTEPAKVPVAHDVTITAQIISAARIEGIDDKSDREVEMGAAKRLDESQNPLLIESIRGRLLGAPPREFEITIKRAIEHSGFDRVTVTQYSQDGGIDVNAFAGGSLWPLGGLLLQVQAKRWLHTVGRREVAELRGSLQPYARGALVTTSHFSRAAITEASDSGKSPITLVDGYAFASLLDRLKIAT